MTPRGRRRHLAGQRSGGVFGKAAGELFTIPQHKGKSNFLDPTKINRRTRQEWGRQRPGGGADKVPSRKVDPNDPHLPPKDRELLDAIAKARLNNKDDNPRVNYDAVRYIDRNGDERILVTRSQGMHSERMGINYLLDDGVPDHQIKDLITERAPCVKNPSCERWLAVNTSSTSPPTVGHIVDYQGGTNLNNNRQATSDVKGWVDSVFAPNSSWRI
ncbi:nucleic acid/nucleotide deaminase domain-containing protein [Actinomadura sp. LOL_016]|uniref:nucleic acid/nucleotide deaminase domain-containing protein n=1 Tax=unclassified Actinomadura TaxID=2626254 RepID=UPI003A7F9744